MKGIGDCIEPEEKYRFIIRSPEDAAQFSKQIGDQNLLAES